MDPIVSIIIPCYNHGEYLPQAIQSVENYPVKEDYEIIIIDDGSSDYQTIQALKDLRDNGYKVLHQPNLGLSEARNNGIRNSKGKYLLMLDADNKIRPEYIEKGKSILDNFPKTGIVYGDSLFFGESEKINKPRSFIIKKILIENYIDACVVMRKEVWIQSKGYDTNLTALEDWDMHLSAYQLGWQFNYIPEIMFEYRYRKDSMSRSIKNKIELVEYISKKHGNLYRKEFLKNITIKARIKGALIDLFKKLTGNPQY